MTFHFPYLDISGFEKKCPKLVPETQEVNSYLTTHPLQEFWCDRFVEEIVRERAVRKDDTLYIVVELTEGEFSAVAKSKEKLKEFSIHYVDSWTDQVLKQLSGY